VQSPPDNGAPEPDWIGQTLDDRYRIVRVLGAGGLGTVYLATHLRLDRSVAVKMLHRDLLPSRELRQRFDREVKTLSRLAHPHIVSLTDSGVLEDGMGYLVMELLEGQSLEERLRDDGPLAPAEAIEIARPVLLGLAEAHQKNVLHRDLKPANLFLQPLAEGVHVKLLDFGLAKVRSELASDPGAYPTLTADGTIVGTPTYMAPEQATGAVVTAAADLYAIGVVLFEMLTGQPPFRSDNKLETIRMHLGQAVPELDEVAPELQPTEELRAFIRRALEKDYAKRFADAREMLKELDALPRPAALLTAPRKPPTPSKPPVRGTEDTLEVRSGELAELELLSLPGLESDLGSSAPPRPPPLGDRETPRVAAPRVAARRGIGRRRAPLVLGAALVAIAVVASAGSMFLGNDETTAPPTPEDDESSEPLSEELAEAAPGPGGVTLANPFASGNLPSELRSARRQVLRGRGLSDAQVREVEAYRRAHPEDLRAPLLLARSARFRGRWADVVRHYVAAYEADEGAVGFSPMLPDLVRAAGDPSASRAASQAIVRIYGASAAPEVDARIEELPPGPERNLLTRLRRRLGSAD
jgi:serine/threonine-protein kinase